MNEILAVIEQAVPFRAVPLSQSTSNTAKYHCQLNHLHEHSNFCSILSFTHKQSVRLKSDKRKYADPEENMKIDKK